MRPKSTVARRRLTLDDRTDRQRERVQRERSKVECECCNPTCGRNKKSNPTSGRKQKNLPRTTSRRRTRQKRTEDNETEQRRDERVLLDRVVDRLGGLSGRPSGRPVSDLPKTPFRGPGPLEAQNVPIVTRIVSESTRDFDGLRTVEFRPLRPVPFRWLARVV